MSPEQAEGKPADKRTDIWSFGVVLYEMLTGRRLFDGKSTSHVLVHVMEQEPDWSALPPLPAGVLPILQRCLQKDRNERLRDIGDVRIQLQDSQTEPIRATEATARPGERRRRWLWPAVAAVALAAATIAVATMLGGRRHRSSRRAALQFEIARPDAFVSSAWIVISPDGRQLVYAATVQGEPARLWVRSLETQTARPLDATAGFVGRPFWSADSRCLAFLADGKLGRSTSPAVRRSSWRSVACGRSAGTGPDSDRIRYGYRAGACYDVSAAGGTPEPVPLGNGLDSAARSCRRRCPMAISCFASARRRGARHLRRHRRWRPARQILPDVELRSVRALADPDLGYILFSRGGAEHRRESAAR